jgi:hypothetical protein
MSKSCSYTDPGDVRQGRGWFCRALPSCIFCEGPPALGLLGPELTEIALISHPTRWGNPMCSGYNLKLHSSLGSATPRAHTGCVQTVVSLLHSRYTGEDGFELSIPNTHMLQLAEALVADPEVRRVTPLAAMVSPKPGHGSYSCCAPVKLVHTSPQALQDILHIITDCGAASVHTMASAILCCSSSPPPAHTPGPPGRSWPP